MRSEKVFENYFHEVSSADFVRMQTTSRSKKTRLHFRQTTTVEEGSLYRFYNGSLSVDDDWCRQFLSIIDVIKSELNSPFSARGHARTVCAEREDLLLSAVNSGTLELANAYLPSSFDLRSLFSQMKLFASLWTEKETLPLSLHDIAAKWRAVIRSSVTKGLILLLFILFSPCVCCIKRENFQRPLKTCLRSTMTQTTLDTLCPNACK